MSPNELFGRVAAGLIADLVYQEQGRSFLLCVGLPFDYALPAARTLASDPSLRIGFMQDPGREVPASLRADSPLTYYRHTDLGERAAVCFADLSQYNKEQAGLQLVPTLDEQWFLREPERWAAAALAMHGLSHVDAFESQISVVIQGLFTAGPDMALDVRSASEFIYEVCLQLEGNKELAGVSAAVSYSLPKLMIPRCCLGDSDIANDADEACGFFAQAKAEFRPYLFLKDNAGNPLNTDDILNNLTKIKELPVPGISREQEALVERIVAKGPFSVGWSAERESFAEIGWETLKNLFEVRTAQEESLSASTLKFFNQRHPDLLEPKEISNIERMDETSSKHSSWVDEFFTKYRTVLTSDPKLIRSWQRLVYSRSIEGDNLYEGLLKLFHQAICKEDDLRNKRLYVRLQDGYSFESWSKTWNTGIALWLAQATRGLPELLSGHVSLDLGLCHGDWHLKQAPVKNTSQKARTFTFEAVVADRAMEADFRVSHKLPQGGRRSVFAWKPEVESVLCSFHHDLGVLADENVGGLYSGLARAESRGPRGELRKPDLFSAATFIDAFNKSEGRLVRSDRSEIRMDLLVEACLSTQAKDLLGQDALREINGAYRAFKDSYLLALRCLLGHGGDPDQAIRGQAEAYAILLNALRAHTGGSHQRLLHDLWTPILRIGVAQVAGEQPMAIVTPWHPLRLLEFVRKRYILRDSVGYLMDGKSGSIAAVRLSQYVEVRADALRRSQFADLALCVVDNKKHLVVERQYLAGYSILGLPLSDLDSPSNESDLASAVDEFDAVVGDYLDLRPHERSNLSTVIYNAELDALPAAVAEKLAERIDDLADLRCDLVVTHERPDRLAEIYDRQNRRIGFEIDGTLTSEAARSFLSRLRVGIVDTNSLSHKAGCKSHDIAYLHDVISRTAEVAWDRHDLGEGDFSADLLPSDVSRRKPFQPGSTTCGVFLTSPALPVHAQGYVDCLRDVLTNAASGPEAHWLPVQQVDLLASPAMRLIDKAHALGSWVVTFDRIADRRVLRNDNLRIIKYVSKPGTDYGVIVSAEISADSLGHRLSSHLKSVMAPAGTYDVKSLVGCIRNDLVQLSGGVVIRGAYVDGYAKELIGLAVSKREVDRALGLDVPKAWFFLDEYRQWMDIKGKLADMMCVAFMPGVAPMVLLTVIEAKYVKQSSRLKEASDSRKQLAATCRELRYRFGSSIQDRDGVLWRSRLADMVVHHVDPFGIHDGRSFETWIQGIRDGACDIRIEGVSVVCLHDDDETNLIAGPDWSDNKKAPTEVQYILNRQHIRQTLDSYLSASGACHVSLPLMPLDRKEGQVNSAPEPADVRLRDPAIAPEAVAEEQPIAEQDHASREEAELTPARDPVPRGWLPEVWGVVSGMRSEVSTAAASAWLEDQTVALQRAFQVDEIKLTILDKRLTPNSGLIRLKGTLDLTKEKLEKKQSALLTVYGIDIQRITPEPGAVVLAVRRNDRAVLALGDLWCSRHLDDASPERSVTMVVGEREEDGTLLYLPLGEKIPSQPKAFPHTLIAGTTGSGKGVLAKSLMLDICAFNSPRNAQIYIIDPKYGADYAWMGELPHLAEPIITDMDSSKALFQRLVEEMEDRYKVIVKSGHSDLDQYNTSVGPEQRLPRVFVFHDEVVDWMVDDDYKESVEKAVVRLAVKSRAAGYHLFLMAQRPDKDALPMQLRTNLGNKLILKVDDKGTSEIALGGTKGAENLLGEGHLMAKVGTDTPIYAQTAYVPPRGLLDLRDAIVEGWRKRKLA